jgi:hypothetical protein
MDYPGGFNLITCVLKIRETSSVSVKGRYERIVREMQEVDHMSRNEVGDL